METPAASKFYYRLRSNFIIALLIFIILFALCFYIATDENWAINKVGLTLNLSTLLLGWVLGWVAGYFITPSNISEKREFSAVAKAVSVFASGYLVAKIDKTVDILLSAEHLFQIAVAFRGMIFVTAFLVSMLITFIFRKYAGEI